MRPARMTLDILALQHNVKRVRALAPKSKILAVIKANAYGHGVGALMPGLSNADALGVAALTKPKPCESRESPNPSLF